METQGRGGGGNAGLGQLTLNITLMEVARGSALLKASLRGTVLEVKKEQDWEGNGEMEPCFYAFC